MGFVRMTYPTGEVRDSRTEDLPPESSEYIAKLEKFALERPSEQATKLRDAAIKREHKEKIERDIA